MEFPGNISRYIVIACLLSAIVAYPTGFAAAQTVTESASGTRLTLPLDTVRYDSFGTRQFTSAKRPSIGLVLSGGGARGLSQVGVLKAIEEAGIYIDFISGTSIGSIVGGLYACGYSAERLDHAIRKTDWEYLLKLSDEADRDDLFVDQKPIADRSVLTLRLDGLQPVLPRSVSKGQRLTNELNELVLQGLYHSRSFDHLSIPFRAVATDLITGNRVVLDSGNLAEAIRASSTVPVMYAAVPIHGMLLVDGGLKTNIPADVARDYGCDIIIVVNTSSPMRTAEQITNPLETMDQVLNLFMLEHAAEQLAMADVVIEPELGGYLPTDFDHPDSLIALGYDAGKSAIAQIEQLIAFHDSIALPLLADSETRYKVSIAGNTELAETAWFETRRTLHDCRIKASELHRSDRFDEVTIEIPHSTDSAIVFTLHERTGIGQISYSGLRNISAEHLAEATNPYIGKAVNATSVRAICDAVLELYRDAGFSLARIVSAEMDDAGNNVHLKIDEGELGTLTVEGNTRTNNVVILRQFPLREGNIFRISDVRRGMRNILGLNLFHYVTFDIQVTSEHPNMIIRVVERPSQMLQIGLMVDNERNAQIGAELKDVNLLGSGSELSILFFAGVRNRFYAAEYKTNQLFYTPFTLALQGYYDLMDYNNYTWVEDLPPDRFEREVASLYRQIHAGASAAFGLNVKRFGSLFAAYRYEDQRITTQQLYRPDADIVHERYAVGSLTFGTTIDTKNKWPYPTKGQYFHIAYETAQRELGGEIAFLRIEGSYETFFPVVLDDLICHPALEVGYGNRALPMTEFFRLGGIYRFYGMRENEFMGRQLFTAHLEFRYKLPVSIFFDTHISVRYDLGRTWDNPEEIKLEDFRHGFGASLGIDTPIGPADFGIGRSFILLRDNYTNPMVKGPVQLYFSIGVPLR